MLRDAPATARTFPTARHRTSFMLAGGSGPVPHRMAVPFGPDIPERPNPIREVRSEGHRGLRSSSGRGYRAESHQQRQPVVRI